MYKQRLVLTLFKINDIMYVSRTSETYHPDTSPFVENLDLKKGSFMPLIDDHMITNLFESNIERTLEFFQHGLSAIARGDVVLEESADVVLREIRYDEDSSALSEAYSNAELTVNRTPIEFTRLDTDPGSAFWVVAYRLKEEPGTVGYAVYSDETPLCETMDAAGLIEFIMEGTNSIDEKISVFASKGSLLVNKIIDIGGFLPD